MYSNGELLLRFVDEDFGLSHKNGSRWGKGEDHDSLVVDKERGIFFFNSRGIVGDPFVYLTSVRNMSFSDAKEYLKTINYVGTHVYTINGDKEDVVVFPKLVDIFFENGRNKKSRDYLYRRGLNDSTIDQFLVGFYNDYVMIPFFSDMTFRNFQMRKDIPTKTIRSYYRNVGPLLFNDSILSIANQVFFVEGPVDAMVMIQNGLPTISTNMSGNVINEWYSKFVNVEQINLLMDNDSAGVQEALRIAKILGVDRCPIYTFSDFAEKGYDPVDFFMDGYTSDDLLEKFYKKSKYSCEIEFKKGVYKGYGKITNI